MRPISVSYIGHVSPVPHYLVRIRSDFALDKNEHSGPRPILVTECNDPDPPRHVSVARTKPLQSHFVNG